MSIAAAIALLERLTLIDGHNDMPFVIWHDAEAKGDVRRWNALKHHDETDTDLPRLKAGRVGVQVMTAFIPTFTPEPLKARIEVLDTMLQLEQLYPEHVHPVRSPDDLARARGRLGQIIAVEGLTGIDSLAHLRLFHAMGVRLVTLCHNETLPFIDSATDAPGQEPLSAFGRAIIAEMERLGLVIDLAHASPAAQHAVLDVATGPTLISHANARALCDHPRNAPDDIIRRIADGGGMVMATFVPAFIAQKVYHGLRSVMDAYGKARPGVTADEFREAKELAFARFGGSAIDQLCDHIEHIRNIGGIDAVGIGSDFYGGPNPPGLDDASCFPALFAALMARGWRENALEKLAGGNFERVWRQVFRAEPRLG